LPSDHIDIIGSPFVQYECAIRKGLLPDESQRVGRTKAKPKLVKAIHFLTITVSSAIVNRVFVKAKVEAKLGDVYE
jgi:hypothetical protein